MAAIIATHIPVKRSGAIPMVPGPIPMLWAWSPVTSQAAPLKTDRPSQTGAAFLTVNPGDATRAMPFRIPSLGPSNATATHQGSPAGSSPGMQSCSRRRCDLGHSVRERPGRSAGGIHRPGDEVPSESAMGDGQRSARSMSRSRLEAFADGAFAIAATLLILNVDTQVGSSPHGLGARLL